MKENQSIVEHSKTIEVLLLKYLLLEGIINTTTYNRARKTLCNVGKEEA